MKGFLENLSKYQKNIAEKVRQLKLNEKLSNINPSGIFDKAKSQYTSLDRKLREDKQKISSGYRTNEAFRNNHQPFDYKTFVDEKIKHINLNKISDKFKNIDTENIKDTAKANIESAKNYMDDFLERSKSAVKAFKESKPYNDRSYNKNTYINNDTHTNNKNNNVNTSSTINNPIYDGKNSVSNQFSDNRYTAKPDPQPSQINSAVSYFKGLIKFIRPQRERTGYDIYVDNFSKNKSGYDQMYKKNFFVKGYRVFKSNFFWKSLLFFSVLTFVYSYAKHMAMGRSYNQQFERFLEMQKQLNESLNNTKKF